MSGAQRAALEALNAARPIVARLDIGKNSEDLAADLIESWNVVETGLRSLVGGSALTGQTLIRELRSTGAAATASGTISPTAICTPKIQAGTESSKIWKFSIVDPIFA